MSFTAAVTNVLQNYANFQGRATRSEYWYWVLLYTIVYLGLLVVHWVVHLVPLVNLLARLIILAFALAVLVPSLAVSFRRIHDIDKSAWWLLLAFIPFGGLVLLVFVCMPGTPGPNRFGGTSFSTNTGPMPMPVGFN